MCKLHGKVQDRNKNHPGAFANSRKEEESGKWSKNALMWIALMKYSLAHSFVCIHWGLPGNSVRCRSPLVREHNCTTVYILFMIYKPICNVFEWNMQTTESICSTLLTSVKFVSQNEYFENIAGNERPLEAFYLFLGSNLAIPRARSDEAAIALLVIRPQSACFPL